MHMSERAFHGCVEAALEQVPAEFRPHLAGVAVVVEDWPPEDLLDALDVPPDETLYGLYTGRALTEGPSESGELPPRITLYRGPLLEDCRDAAELQREITITVLHEVAHHLEYLTKPHGAARAVPGEPGKEGEASVAGTT